MDSVMANSALVHALDDSVGKVSATFHIQANLNRVMKEASSLQDVSSMTLHDLDGEIDEVREEIEVKAIALEVQKQRMKAEINEFRDAANKQMEDLASEFSAKIRDMEEEVAQKERRWDEWKSFATESREAFSRGMADNEKNVNLYEMKVRELKTKRETLAASLRLKIRQMNSMLDEEHQREIRTHGTIEQQFQAKLLEMEGSAEADFKEAEGKWADCAKEIQRVFGGIAQAVYNKKNRG